MPPIRLIGLFLFITSLFLALMAMATRTSHIDVKRPDRVVAAEQSQPLTSDISGQATDTPSLQFASVPIIYPLVALGAIGLLLWFIPSLAFPQAEPKKKRRSSSRRKSSKRRTPATR